jgi:adenine-specific DNA-methyltransferase
VRRIIEIASKKDELVLDCFAGSGTTGAVAHKTGRRWVQVEAEESCLSLIRRRMAAVVDGSDQGGVSKEASWNGGGGFRYCTLGEPLFDETGSIRESVTFPELAAHVFFTETGAPVPQPVSASSPLLGSYDGKAVYLLFNGVLGDRRPAGGNVLTGDVLRHLRAFDGARVVYGEGCRLGADRLRQEGVVFRQIPYEIKVS